jgi:outer membrane protein OmpA-like peptidoglycan-associated protein
MIGGVLEEILTVQPEKASERNANRKPVLVLAVMLMVGAGYGGYRYYEGWRDERTAQALLGRFRSDRKLALYRIEPEVHGRLAVLHGAVPSEALAEEAERIALEWPEVAEVENALVIAEAPVQAVERALMPIREQLRKWSKIPPVSVRLHFGFASSELRPEAEEKLALMQLALAFYPEAKVRITGYSDLKGSEEGRRKIALRRAANVAEALQRLGVDADRLVVEAKVTLPPGLDATDYRDAEARRVDVTLVGGHEESQEKVHP